MRGEDLLHEDSAEGAENIGTKRREPSKLERQRQDGV
jgi:hypothetical protein